MTIPAYSFAMPSVSNYVRISDNFLTVLLGQQLKEGQIVIMISNVPSNYLKYVCA